MNTKSIIWLSLFMTGFCTFSRAQYNDVTHRQTQDDIRLFRSWTLKEQIMHIEQGGGSIPYGVSYYDTGGRVIFIANPNHHEHFSYDDKGRMVYWLDSASDGRRFEKHEYHFGYDEKGALNTYKTSTTESKFTAAGDVTVEDIKKNGLAVGTKTYSYNSDRKLIQEMDYEGTNDTARKLLYFHKMFYNKYGDLASEIIYNPLKDCKGDSTVIINTYDSKAKLIHKQKSIKTMKCGSPASVTERKTSTESISYTYNAAGQLTVEAMTSSDPAQSYRKEYVYDIHGIILKELRFDGKGKPTTDTAYSYIYYPIKRK